jgi:hypothetical protein
MATIFQGVEAYIKQLEEELRKAAPKKTGALKKSVNSDMTTDANAGSASIYFEMNAYGDAIDKGVNGNERSWGSPYSFSTKKPPASAFSGYTTSLSGQFAIANSIYKKGIKPRNFVQPVFSNAEAEIAEIAEDDLTDYLSKVVEDNLNAIDE